MSNMAGAVKETGTDCPSRTSEFIPGFWWGLCSSSFEFSALYFSPSSCVLYCQFHWIVHSGLPLRPVYCTVSFTGSSIRDCPFVLCIVLSVSLDRPFGIVLSEFSNVYILFSLTLECDFLPRYHVNLNGYIIYRFIKIHKRDVLILC